MPNVMARTQVSQPETSRIPHRVACPLPSIPLPETFSLSNSVLSCFQEVDNSTGLSGCWLSSPLRGVKHKSLTPCPELPFSNYFFSIISFHYSDISNLPPL